MNIKRVPISDVEVWEKNPKNVKTVDFERLKEQILELGVYKPLICVKENGKYITLGGNMRIRALQSLNHTEVDISIVKADTDALKLKFALSDNDRVGTYIKQDLAELVFQNIEEINLDNYKIDVASPINLREVIEEYGPSSGTEDEVPEVDGSPAITKPGDLLQLGRYRLMCGDCTNKEEVKRLMGGKKADMVFTDPPYDFKEYSFDNCFENCEKDIFIMHTGRKFIEIFKNHRDLFKEYFVIHHRQPFWQHSNYAPIIYHILIGHFAGSKIKRKKLRIGSVIEIGSMYSRETDFYQSKKIELIEPFITNYSSENDIIVDFFGGSGSFLIACHKYRRISYNMEIDPKMCDLIIERFSKYSGINKKDLRNTGIEENPG